MLGLASLAMTLCSAACVLTTNSSRVTDVMGLFCSSYWPYVKKTPNVLDTPTSLLDYIGNIVHSFPLLVSSPYAPSTKKFWLLDWLGDTKKTH